MSSRDSSCPLSPWFCVPAAVVWPFTIRMFALERKRFAAELGKLKRLPHLVMYE